MDKAKASAFMDTMLGFMNGGSMALMCSIGHRTGLFDAMAGNKSFTSQLLAETTSLDERYVREWLSAMAAGGVVDYNPEFAEFTLPPEHATLVTRAGGPLNVANLHQFIALMGQVEDDVVEAFRTGAGVGYDRYPAFQALMAEQSSARFDAALFEQIVPNIPTAEERLRRGATLADIGCGAGHALLMLAEKYPKSEFCGYDFSEETMATANAHATERGLTNLGFVALDAAEISDTEVFDFVTTFDAIHDQAKPKIVLSNIFGALKPGGWYLCVEPKASSELSENLEEPMAPYMYTVSTMHCMSVSIAGGGEGLGTAWGTELATEYLLDAGFRDIEPVPVKADRANTHLVARKPA